MGVDEDTMTAELAADLDGTFEQLVRLYQDRLFGFALRLTNEPRDAEEIAQDAFVRAYTAMKTYAPERIQALALRPWLFQIAVNVFRNRVRSKKPKTTSLTGLDGWEPEDTHYEAPERAAERALDRSELEASVAALPERYRTAVVLRHVVGLSYDEVAETLGQPVGTAKANVHRGLQQLRQQWIEQTVEVR